MRYLINSPDCKKVLNKTNDHSFETMSVKPSPLHSNQISMVSDIHALALCHMYLVKGLSLDCTTFRNMLDLFSSKSKNNCESSCLIPVCRNYFKFNDKIRISSKHQTSK